jgi:hypothetical protein
MANFAAVRASPPRLLLAISQPKIKLQNRRSNPTGHQDSTHIAVARRRLSPPFASAQASLLLASVFFWSYHHHHGSWWWWYDYITPQSSIFGSPMQGKWERNWRRGEALWQGGMAAIWPSQLTKKSWQIWGWHNNHLLHSLPQGWQRWRNDESRTSGTTMKGAAARG